jgi:hypothetical protein
MKSRTFESSHIHSSSGVLVQYIVDYRFTSLGAVYEGHALIDGKKVRFVLGVRPWGLWALRPRHRIQCDVVETLEFSSMEKLVTSANEA